MHFMMKPIAALFFIGLTHAQFHLRQNINHFRPSPVDHLANIRGNYNPSEYNNNYQPASFGVKHIQQYLPQQHILPQLTQELPQQHHNFDFGDFNNVEQPPTGPLFTPADEPYPSETAGQIEAYNKALEEEQQEALKDTQELPNQFYNGNQFNSGANFGRGQSYVSVEFGGPNNLKYQYSV